MAGSAAIPRIGWAGMVYRVGLNRLMVLTAATTGVEKLPPSFSEELNMILLPLVLAKLSQAM
jgi:hypothetical protein